MQVKGRIHSIETCGTVDGPGIRFLIFMQGCPLRCVYCHNPDTWHLEQGETISSKEIFSEIIKYKNFLNASNGGVTITGGEPLMQPDFTREVFRECKKEKIHTVLDTSGYLFNKKSLEVLEQTDLVLLDLKSLNREMFKKITGKDLQPVKEFAKYLSSINKKIWIRHVLLPGYTDSSKDITKLGKFISELKNVERVDVLPFHKMGEYKWKELNCNYQLFDVDEPTEESIKITKNILKNFNLNVR